MCESQVTLNMAACSGSKLVPPSVVEERACAPTMLAFGVQNMCLLDYESAPCEAPAPSKPPAPSPLGILKKREHVLGDATPFCHRVRFSPQERVHVYSDATAGLPTAVGDSVASHAAVHASTKSSGKKRRRSEAEILQEFNMEKEGYYSNQPTLPRFQICWPDFIYRNPNKGNQPEDCTKRDPDYSPEHAP